MVVQFSRQGQFSVAIVAGDLGGRGGVNRALSELALIFCRNLGLDVTIFARGGETPAYSFPDDIKIEIRPRTNSNVGMLRLLWEIRQRKFDAVIGVWHNDNLRIAPFFWRSETKSVLVENISWHHPPFKTRFWRLILYKLANWIVVLNDKELNYYSRLSRNVTLIPNPVLVGQTVALKKEKIVLCVGHLCPLKNFGDALFAFQRSGIEQDGWQLVLLGDGEKRHELAKLAADLGIANIEFHPETENIEAWYARSSILLCTSKIEVFSLAVAESTAFGVVPLSYDVDGPAYLLRDFPRLLVTANDRIALSERLRWLVESGSLSVYSKKVRTLCADRFSATSIAQAWRTILLPDAQSG